MTSGRLTSDSEESIRTGGPMASASKIVGRLWGGFTRAARHSGVLVVGAFRVLKEDSFESRSVQRAREISNRRRQAHKAGTRQARQVET